MALLLLVFFCALPNYVQYEAKPMHWYLDVNDSVMESDHKPLKQIVHKNLADTPARLQGMMM